MRTKRWLSVIAMLLFVVDIQGQTNNGTYSFLDMTSSSRVAALGNTDLSIYDSDIQLGIYNPALINSDMHNDVVLSYVNYYADINYGMVQYGRTFNKIGSFVGTVQFHSYGKMDYADEQGNLTGGTFTPSDYNIMIGWGRQLTPEDTVRLDENCDASESESDQQEENQANAITIFLASFETVTVLFPFLGNVCNAVLIDAKRADY